MSDVSQPPSSRATHLRSLTSLRLVAAMAVLLFHLFSLIPHSLQGQESVIASGPIRDALLKFAPFLAEGHLAVDFFFVLSGFVLAHVYLDAWTSGRFAYGRFLRKRIARLYPLHVVTLLAFVALAVVTSALGMGPRDQAGYDYGTLPFHLTMTHGWGTIERLTFNGPSWSISAEWAAYLAFPLVVAVLTRMKPLVAVVLSVGWFLLLNTVGSTPGHLLTQRSADFGALRIAAEFPMGVALLMLSRVDVFATRRIGHIAFYGGVFAAVTSASFAVTPSVTVLSLAALVFGAAVAERHGGLNWLGQRWLVYGGEISYSIYMTHALVQVVLTQVARKAGLMEGSFTFDVVLLSGVLVTFVASHVSYQWIEKPGQKWIAGRNRNETPLPSATVRGATAVEHTTPVDADVA